MDKSPPKQNPSTPASCFRVSGCFHGNFCCLAPQVVSSLDPDENPDTNIKPGPGHENFQESPWIQDDIKDVKMDVLEESVEDTWRLEKHRLVVGTWRSCVCF